MPLYACSAGNLPAKFDYKSRVSINVIFENRSDGVPVFRAGLFSVHTRSMAPEILKKKSERKKKRWRKSVVTLDFPPPTPLNSGK